MISLRTETHPGEVGDSSSDVGVVPAGCGDCADEGGVSK